jgi:transketolase
MINYRRIVVDKLVPYAEQDKKIVLLVSDMGFGVIDTFKEKLPDRVYNVGIMEQGAVGIAAGMAMTGLVPVFYSIVNFLAFRAIEQVRNDVVLQNLNVKFISTGVDNYFNALGHSHTCAQDDIKLMNLINMPVYNPYDSPDTDFEKLFDNWITSPKTGYLRV